MSRLNRRQLAAIIAGICFSFFSLCQTSNAGPQASDEPSLRALAEAFFAAYSKKDIDSFTRLWSEKSPGLAARRRAVEKLFADSEKIEVNGLAIRKLAVEGDKATLRLALEMQATDGKTGKPLAGFGKMNRLMELVKEAGAWQVWRELSVEEELARQVAAATTDAQRRELLAADEERNAKELNHALLSQSERVIIQGNYEQAMGILLLTLGLAEQSGDPVSIASTLNYIGRVQHFQARSDLALASFKRGLALGESTGNQLVASRMLSSLGNVYSDQGNYGLALECFQKSLRIVEALKDKPEIAIRLNNIGSIHYLQGNYELAMQFYEKGLALEELSGNKFRMAGGLHNIGLVHSAQGRPEQAINYFKRTLAIGEELGAKPGIALTMLNIGSAYFQQGDWARALEHYEKVLAVYESLGDQPGTAYALNGMAKTCLAQSDFKGALNYAERAAQLSRTNGRAEPLWQARATAGKAYRALNQPEQARAAFEEAIETIESIRTQLAGGRQEQERFFEGRVSPYYAMVELLLAENNPHEALAFAERAKGRGLLDVLRSDRVNVTKAMTAMEQEQERQLISHLVSLNTQMARANAGPQPDPARLADLKTQLQTARLDHEAFQTSLYAAHPKLKVQRGQIPPFRLEQAADLLPDPKGALLEYVVTDEKSYLFVITRFQSPDGQKSRAAANRLWKPILKVYELNVKRKDLADRAARFRQRLANHDRDFAESARDLYRLLVEPARAQLQGKTRLAVVADAVLWELPFQALQSADNRYLIEDHAIGYAPSLMVLREMMKERRPPHDRADGALTLLALGNPAPANPAAGRAGTVAMGEKSGLLPEAERQVKTLGQLYGAAHSRVYVGLEARENVLKAEAGKYRILHLATHGILNDASPMYSHLLLSPGEKAGNEDGLLEAWEVMQLELNASLVVLSACDTARGRIGAGEGVIGLSWALFVAGCPTTVVSQWQVESASTTELMIAFHRNLQSAHMTEAEALRQAALELLRGKPYRHPFFWAAFVVMGDGF